MNIVILTGAGISAESGLPTFTGTDGLWNGHRIEDVCAPDALERNPEAVCAFYDERKAEAASAEPNPAHAALAELERHWQEAGKGEFLVVTQNVDDLHERAGSKSLIHMHGQLNSAFCMECGRQDPRHGRLEGSRECPGCDRDALRPDIVLFGETPRHLRQIEAALEKCDLFVAIGTSGNVYPAAGFAEIAKAHGAETHRFDIKLTGKYDLFDKCHLGEASQTVPAWVDELTSEKSKGWGLTVEQKAAFIKEMGECGAHVTFYCNEMVRYLADIGLDAEELTDGSLRLYDQVIQPTPSEWGDPGIYAPAVLTAAIVAHGLGVKTEMLGRDFGHQDRLSQLAQYWNII
jgi:NAD-dependent deacetylase